MSSDEARSGWQLAPNNERQLSMKTIKNIGLENVQAVYDGPEGDLWELVMGEQIHIGGFQSSMDLAKRAGIGLLLGANKPLAH